MKCVYIFNPNSGKKKHVKMQDYIVKKLLDKFEVVDVKPTKKRGDAKTFASEACGVYDVIVVAGGDGTLNEVINGIAESEIRPKIGYIPTGTTNDLARSLKIPFNIKKALKLIIDGNSLKHDIFKANDKYGIYVCAFGIFTSASYSAKQSTKNKLGKLAYYFSGITEIGKTKKFPITLKTTNIIALFVGSTALIAVFPVNV
jgi:YegS/Rv2252/BmrU family lipid kinase